MTCAAYELSLALCDEELFVLMASQHLEKTRRNREFPVSDLQLGSLLKQLHPRGVVIGDVLRGLSRKGMIEPGGPGRIRCTQAGNDVKHPFNGLRNELELRDRLRPQFSRSLEFVAELRAALRALCEEELRTRR
ncbi:MAG TPA: hypothetical protein VJ547_06840 [Candidatus Thermoplasmatota archaeon]|nr:hypothetical protein [Candidatus Thermoplasmatota archaeon]